MLIRWSTHDREGSVFGQIGGAVLRRVGAVLVWLFRVPPPRRAGLFEFHDGTRARRADALEAWQRLRAAVGGSWAETLSDLDRDDPPAATVERVGEAAVKAFGVRPHSDDPAAPPGMTLAARVRLVAAFIAYVVTEAARDRLFASLVAGGFAALNRPAAPAAKPTPAPAPTPAPEPTPDA